MNRAFWRGRRVFLTGHTGFKGGWLALWLQDCGAEVTGYALPPPTTPSLFELAGVADNMRSVIGDIRDLSALTAAVAEARPEVVFHLAAQPLVRYSYTSPVETYATNVMGTVNLLEAVRAVDSVRAVVVITTDKCYENREWVWGYRENEPMGGYDPYSNSKGCAELVTAAYRSSFFNPARYAEHGVAVASVRAGNVIGGGDWAQDRLVPDIVRAFLAGQPVEIRNPHAIRPWQHVLDPLNGYLVLAERLCGSKATAFAEGWNFGPAEDDAEPVQAVVEQLATCWGDGASWRLDGGEHPHEAHFLRLDCAKARTRLGWRPRWPLAKALTEVAGWYKAFGEGKNLRSLTLQQIETFERD